MDLHTSSFKTGMKLAHQKTKDSRISSELHKIQPLYAFLLFLKEVIMIRPVFHYNLVNSHRLRQRFRVDGNKYFGKLSASGPETFSILDGIKRSHCIKLVQNFEFDP